MKVTLCDNHYNLQMYTLLLNEQNISRNTNTNYSDIFNFFRRGSNLLGRHRNFT